MNRLARKGGGSVLELGRDIARIRSIFETMKAQASSDVALANQYHHIERPLVYFVDFMMSESSVPYAGDWKWLEEEMYDELVGQTRFFELLDETLADPSPAATERLEVFYTCIGLGFTGFYSDEPEHLRRKMLEIQNRIRDRVELHASPRFIPENELAVNTSNLYEPPGKGLGVLALTLGGLIVLLIIVNAYLFFSSEASVQGNLDTIEDVAAGQGYSALKGADR